MLIDKVIYSLKKERELGRAMPRGMLGGIFGEMWRTFFGTSWVQGGVLEACYLACVRGF